MSKSGLSVYSSFSPSGVKPNIANACNNFPQIRILHVIPQLFPQSFYQFGFFAFCILPNSVLVGRWMHCIQYQYIQVEIVLYQGQPDGLFHGLIR